MNEEKKTDDMTSREKKEMVTSLSLDVMKRVEQKKRKKKKKVYTDITIVILSKCN